MSNGLRLILVPFTVVAVASSVALGSGAKAASITNADGAEHGLSIIEGSRKRDLHVKAGDRIDQICKDGCIVRVDADTGREFILEGTERVSIENGLIYYDGEVVAKSGETEKPAKSE